jgi:hypothetical protein
MNRIARSDIPIVIASIGPSNVERTAEDVGGMGAKSKNYSNDRFRRCGWKDEEEKIQDLFRGRQRARRPVCRHSLDRLSNGFAAARRDNDHVGGTKNRRYCIDSVT